MLYIAKSGKGKFLSSIILLTGLILFSGQTIGQNLKRINVSGQVLEETTGTPLIGVNIVVKGTQTGTITDTDGHFLLTINAGDVLVFSYVGYETLEQTFAKEGSYTIRLRKLLEVWKKSSLSLRICVKKEVTGSIASVRPDAFNKVHSMMQWDCFRGRWPACRS
jgi:iron complex outermembrane receptor protein